ncbi:unnamed protein product [Didymodactylos carnosus]|uniref:Uncharacterized protein n=1 Tax=Didymodactylos carnosus TaxID=1234261 RepID=A0A8S2E9R4_9BILA|nr:unnamed protein product [Didymodactylos carnosus]CAF3868685.1 unnamed protein product [Didymodactylos carnosus]
MCLRFLYPTIRCEEHVCSSLLFSCGETGTCQRVSYPGYDDMKCATGRDCNELIDLYCPTSFQFPSQPVFSNFVRLYYSTTTKTDWSISVSPTHICYDAERCTAFSPTIKIDQYDCRKYNEFQWIQNIHSNWPDLLKDIRLQFRFCSQFNFPDLSSSLLFNCNGSSKYISIHRLQDTLHDCINSSDEKYSETCSLNMSHRFQCIDTSITQQCLSQITVKDSFRDCLDGSDEPAQINCAINEFPFSRECQYLRGTIKSNDDKVVLIFSQICNGVKDIQYSSNITADGDDETDCDAWPCITQYTRCNQVWNCKRGEDELNCPKTEFMPKYSCNSENEHYCARPNEYTLGCISVNNTNDGVIDCLGATDERDYCRQMYPDNPEIRYR